jgi:hypothetical protein
MAKTLRNTSFTWLLGAAVCACAMACSDNGNGTPTNPGSGGGAPDSGTPQGGGGSVGGGGNTGGGGGASFDASDAPNYAYTLIDDMETTTHGPIQFAGIAPPESPGYWFNFGADSMGDTATPPITLFTFATLPSPMTWRGKASTQAAHQFCSLVGRQYVVCGLGFEFAQVPLADAGAAEAGSNAADSSVDATGNAGGDAGPPMVTVPFDISAYKGISFWGKATAEAGTVDVKVQFPNTDTDPRGGVCNGPRAGVGIPTDIRRCYDSYAVHKSFTGDWQQFTVLFSDLAIEGFGFMSPAPFNVDTDAGPRGSKNVYGVNWQGQKNTMPDAGAVSIDFWVDDVYFIQ